MDLLVQALAAWRLTRLAQQDFITSPLRDHFHAAFPAPGQLLTGDDGWRQTKDGRVARWVKATPFWSSRIETPATHVGDRTWVADGHPLGVLASCPWCLSVWASAAILAAWRATPLRPLVRLLAVSAAAGFAADRTQ